MDGGASWRDRPDRLGWCEFGQAGEQQFDGAAQLTVICRADERDAAALHELPLLVIPEGRTNLKQLCPERAGGFIAPHRFQQAGQHARPKLVVGAPFHVVGARERLAFRGKKIARERIGNEGKSD